ncbi:hypothetical protein [Sphingobacterium siyangense]
MQSIRGLGSMQKYLVENTADNVGIETDIPAEKLSVNAVSNSFKK